ncbi:MAG: PqqD family protein [Elusimicrobia bacterium]|nr:PqqD family protein [Elusimicrobiota bacterium]
MPPTADEFAAYSGKRYRKSPGLIAKAVAGETILVPVRRRVGGMDRIFTLNGPGAFIWRQIERDATVEAVVRLVRAEYDVDEETAREDVVGLIKDLARLKAVSRVRPAR